MPKIHTQIAYGLLTTLFLSGFSRQVLAEETPAPWILDGSRLCSFEGTVTATRCTQYHQAIEHKLPTGQVWQDYRYKWIAGHDEVAYSTDSGILGIDYFTTGYITFRKQGKIVYNKEKSVSYSASREELIIGIPGTGYSFSMKGEL